MNDERRAALSQAWRLFPHTFAQKASGGKWKPYKHLTYLSAKLTPGLIKGGGRYIVTMPPRHGKSEFISHWIPTWYLDAYPDRRIGLASYAAAFSKKWGRKVRREFEINPHCKNKLNPVASAANYFEIENGPGEDNGFMMTAGVEGPFTGEGFNLLIIDDPIKNWKEAASETKRQSIKDWWQAVAETRLEPGATVIILMTRWHEDDLVGWLLGMDKDEDTPPELLDEWEVINMPAIAEEGVEDPIGRKPGEALCPERYNEKALAKKKHKIGPRFWNALFQQKPTAVEGEILKRHWWQYTDKMPSKFDQMIQSWDLRFGDKKNSGSYVVGQVWGRIKAKYYLVHQVRGRWSFEESKREVIKLTIMYPSAYVKIVENKANGPALENSLKNDLTGIRLVDPGGSKLARVEACEGAVSSGNVTLPSPEKCSWVNGFVDECSAFSPVGAHKFDDQVDTATQAIIYFEDRTNSALLKLINT